MLYIIIIIIIMFNDLKRVLNFYHTENFSLEITSLNLQVVELPHLVMQLHRMELNALMRV